MAKKSVKIVELILAACCLAMRYGDVRSLTSSHLANLKTVSWEDTVACITYFGYPFLLTIFTLAAISGEMPRGVYMIFFNTCGAVLYAFSELIFHQSHWTYFTVLTLGATMSLVVILILDCLNISF